jgi:hypothetical protein
MKRIPIATVKWSFWSCSWLKWQKEQREGSKWESLSLFFPTRCYCGALLATFASHWIYGGTIKDGGGEKGRGCGEGGDPERSVGDAALAMAGLSGALAEGCPGVGMESGNWVWASGRRMSDARSKWSSRKWNWMEDLVRYFLLNICSKPVYCKHFGGPSSLFREDKLFVVLPRLWLN